MKRRRPHTEEAVWKRKFERLAQFMDDAKFDIKQKGFDKIPTRAWDACPEIFVSFAFDVCDSEANAIKWFGKGNYEVYKLVRAGDDPYEVPDGN